MAKLKWLIKGTNFYYFKDTPTHVSSISLNKNKIKFTAAGQTSQLIATITPSDAVLKSVMWSSSDESIATVNSNGLVTCISVGDCTITAMTVDGGLTATCNVRQPQNISVDFLLIGGGGGGGGAYYTTISGGGGGGGGFVECYSRTLASGTYPVVIGTGGTGNSGNGNNGGNSTFNSVIAYGGGGGGVWNGQGCNGGSGGGTGGSSSCNGGVGCSGQGYAGGKGRGGDFSGGAGGGGAGGIGEDAKYEYGGAGGIGKASSMSGTSTYYSGGGGGGSCCYNNPGTGGTGGGGTGADATYYGGGGAGGQMCRTPYNGRGYAGCKGVFILRYPTACGYSVTGGTKYTCGTYTIHCFTSNGNLVVD